MFPPLFASAALGYCNLLARLFTSMSALLASLEEPAPMWIFTITAAVAAILSLGLKPAEEISDGESNKSEENSVRHSSRNFTAILED